ncbi:MAG TPA: c-type cytochrome [Polyangiaceae bacterium]
MQSASSKLALCALIVGCSSSPSQPDAGPDAGAPALAGHSSAMAITHDGATLYVVNPDADSVSVVDTAGRTLSREVLLGASHPELDGSGNFAPAVMPRALALSPDEKTLYVPGERSGALHVVDVASGAVTKSVPLCSEPVGVLVSQDGASVFAACSQDDSVVRVDTASMTVAARVAVGTEPWALAASSDGKTLFATQFLTAQVTPIDVASFTAKSPMLVPDVAPRGDKRLAHGQPRGFYDAETRPGTSELWVVGALLATDTAQPDLDFESTAFAELSVLNADGSLQRTLSINAQDVAGTNGAISDVVSGPHTVVFTRDGAFALVVNTNSEDVLVMDAAQHVESSLLHPLPGHQPEAIVFSPDETHAYLQERNTNDVVVLDVTRSATGMILAVDGAPIATLASDPMPATMRLGQHLFYSANSDEYPITKNHWISCATCHMEGRSDAVTWRFAQGPRDTPTNAGGTIGTGFLFRTADRQKVQDYWRTINTEQGGNFDPNVPAEATLLDAIENYVDHGIPLPIAPTTDPQKVAQGQTVFQNNGCNGCHSGPRFTDSGAGNATLDLTGPVILHDVGTCVTSGPFNDVAHTDIDNDARAACMFDTPSLNGVSSSPPYFHDGSAATLADAASRMLSGTGKGPLSQEDLDALVEYLRSL